MISLRKLIEFNPSAQSAEEAPTVAAAYPVEKGPKDPTSLLPAYQSVVPAMLKAMGASAQRAVPNMGDMIASTLGLIADSLNRLSSSDALRKSEREVELELRNWADSAHKYHSDNEKAIRDLLHVIAEAAETTGSRDERFGREIVDLSERLRAVSKMENVPIIRRSIADNANALANCATKMADEGRASIQKLTSEIAEYESRLEAMERRALTDPLTGICNRRGFEQELARLISAHKPFSLLVADLNEFKAANDRYGHLAGDEILRQFANELKTQFRNEDTVARWGGDEFVCIVIGSGQEADTRADRIRHWVLGDYKIPVDDHVQTININAAIGAVYWNGAETGDELFARADKEMYKAKESSRQPA